MMAEMGWVWIAHIMRASSEPRICGLSFKRGRAGKRARRDELAGSVILYPHDDILDEIVKETGRTIPEIAIA